MAPSEPATALADVASGRDHVFWRPSLRSLQRAGVVQYSYCHRPDQCSLPMIALVNSLHFERPPRSPVRYLPSAMTSRIARWMLSACSFSSCETRAADLVATTATYDLDRPTRELAS